MHEGYNLKHLSPHSSTLFLLLGIVDGWVWDELYVPIILLNIQVFKDDGSNVVVTMTIFVKLRLTVFWVESKKLVVKNGYDEIIKVGVKISLVVNGIVDVVKQCEA